MAEHKRIRTQVYFLLDEFEALFESVVETTDRVEDYFRPIISKQVPFHPFSTANWPGYTAIIIGDGAQLQNSFCQTFRDTLGRSTVVQVGPLLVQC